jgi:myo-inositol 2-dehydrogenase/D-chiro-inositol 1-dehydrogenase/scyllo-inositol 2-dehydrogenase (NAD+)
MLEKGENPQGILNACSEAMSIVGAEYEKGDFYLAELEQLNQNSVVTCSKANGMATPIIASWSNLFEDAYLREDTDFVKCIREDREPAVAGLDGMMAVKVVNAGNVSIKNRRPVTL